MQLFYIPDLEQNIVSLSSEESRHCVKVLRKGVGDVIYLTDGRGLMAKAELLSASPNACSVQIVERHEEYGKRPGVFHLAVAPTKNPGRMEWLVEKAIEIGVEKMSFVICDHSERDRVDMSRMERIAVSALKQSNTAQLPVMQSLSLDELMKQYENRICDKLMAWCDDDNDVQLVDVSLTSEEVLLLIGPEGDFSPREVELARKNQFKEVKLGNRRLRTETAALYGCCLVAASFLHR